MVSLRPTQVLNGLRITSRESLEIQMILIEPSCHWLRVMTQRRHLNTFCLKICLRTKKPLILSKVLIWLSGFTRMAEILIDITIMTHTILTAKVMKQSIQDQEVVMVELVLTMLTEMSSMVTMANKTRTTIPHRSSSTRNPKDQSMA